MRYVVTGGCGQAGSRLVAALAALEETEAISVVDVRRPDALPPKAHHHGFDVTNAQAMRRTVASIAPDAIVHLAFAGPDVREGDAIYANDVGGTNAVLEAAAGSGVEHVLVESSAAAYGAFPDNPVPLTEDCVTRGSDEWEHARVRAAVDRLCQLWAVRYADRSMTIVRPATVVGPGVDSRGWRKRLLSAGSDRAQKLQFLHVDDYVAALLALVAGRHRGVFNVAGDGTVTVDEGARVAGVRRRRLPGGSLDFARYPWVVSTDRLRKATGWEPRYSSSAALRSAVA